MGVDDEQVWVGFDLGASKMQAAVYDTDGGVLAGTRHSTGGADGAAVGLERIASTIREALEVAGRNASELGGIGIGCPGPVDPDRGVLIEAINLGWTDVAVAEILSSEFDCGVVVTNDVDAGVYGEYRFGSARDARCVFGVFPGTGIGGGCVYEGRIFRGADRTAMEIGLMPLMPLGPLSGTARRGTLDQVANRLAISSAAAAAAYRGDAPALREIAGTDVALIRSSELKAAIAAGDRVVEQIVREAAELIGLAVAGIVQLLAPDVVVLGGGMVEALPELFVEEIDRTARGRVLEAYRDRFRVVTAELGDDAVVMGAAAWARETLDARTSV